MASGDLTPKMEGFCQSYIETGNASEAYRRHYDCSKMKSETVNRNAFALLENNKIAARIEELKKRVLQRHDVTVDYVLDAIKTTMERCMQVRPVLDATGKPRLTEGPNGEVVPAFQFDAANVLKATDQLGRYLKMFTDKTEVSNPDGSMRPPAPVYNIVNK